MEYLDKQMKVWSTRLRDNLRIEPPESNCLATTIAEEISSLVKEARQRIQVRSPIPLKTRIEELIAFQQFMDHVDGSVLPAVVRAQVVYQNYICFVYLGESCFTAIRKELPTNSTTHKCCRFLTDNPVRAFRNAISHSNWRYLPDFSGLEFWARKGASREEPLARFEVSQRELNFWQTLARTTAYAAFLRL